jgi:uncharacterized membrane protein YdbT with pleckstrin-like domain
MDKEILSVLETQEQIVWQDVINRKVMVFNLVLSLVILMIVWGIASGFKVGTIFLIAGLFIIVINFISNYVKKYIITNKRVLIRSGIIGTDFKSIYFTEVKSADVNVGLIDKIFSVGTISIDTGKMETVTTGEGNNRSSRTQTAYDRLIHISNPYEVYKYFQTALTNRQESLYSGRADTQNNPIA